MMVSAAEGPTRRPRILIVEDHEDTLHLYLTYLDYEGFQVQGACNGWEALAQARVFLPDVIVMDLNLPGLDGWTATQRLKADPQTRHIAVIAVSGHAMLDGQQRARESGCDLFLAKPCLPEDLARAIQRLLTRPAPARSPRKAS